MAHKKSRRGMTLIALDDAKEWDAALAPHAHTPAHTHWFTKAISHSHAEPVALWHEGDSFCVVKQRAFKDVVDITTPYGFGGFVGKDPASFEATAKQQGWVCGYLALHPLLAQPADAVDDGRIYHCIDLQRTPDELLAAMPGSDRTALRGLQKKGLHLIEDKTILAQHVAELYAQTFARVNASPLYRFSPQTLMDILHHEHCIALGLGESAHVPQAIILVPHTALVGDYFLNASNMEGRGYSRLLLWHAMLRLQENDVPWFNLGGGAKTKDGLDDFKSGLGSIAKPFLHMRQIYDEAKFAELTAQTTADNGYFPPYRYTP